MRINVHAQLQDQQSRPRRKQTRIPIKRSMASLSVRRIFMVSGCELGSRVRLQQREGETLRRDVVRSRKSGLHLGGERLGLMLRRKRMFVSGRLHPQQALAVHGTRVLCLGWGPAAKPGPRLSARRTGCQTHTPSGMCVSRTTHARPRRDAGRQTEPIKLFNGMHFPSVPCL